jgi:hypothetical protein
VFVSKFLFIYDFPNLVSFKVLPNYIALLLLLLGYGLIAWEVPATALHL